MKDKKSSKIRISIISGTKKYLSACESPQNQWVEFQITHPEQGRVAEVAMSMQQFAQMLATNSETECTIEYMMGKDGQSIKEKPEAPKTATEELSENLTDTNNKLNTKTKDLIQDIEEMLDKPSVSKKKLKEALHNLNVIQSWQVSNQKFFLEEAKEKVERINSEKKIELINMFSDKKITQEEGMRLLGFKESIKMLTPKTEDYKQKEREEISIKDMNKRQLSEFLNDKLRSCEVMYNESSKKKKSLLFTASAREAKNGIKICYVSYQGEILVSEKDARLYATFLDKVDKIENFKQHFSYLRILDKK